MRVVYRVVNAGVGVMGTHVMGKEVSEVHNGMDQNNIKENKTTKILKQIEKYKKIIIIIFYFFVSNDNKTEY